MMTCLFRPKIIRTQQRHRVSEASSCKQQRSPEVLEARESLSSVVLRLGEPESLVSTRPPDFCICRPSPARHLFSPHHTRCCCIYRSFVYCFSCRFWSIRDLLLERFSSGSEYLR